MSQKLIKEVSPSADGRHSLAPTCRGREFGLPLPRQVGRCHKRGWGPFSPGLPIKCIATGFALGYNISSLPGLRKAPGNWVWRRILKNTSPRRDT